MDQSHRNDGKLPKVKGTPIRSDDKLASATKSTQSGSTHSGGSYGGRR